ncbi:MAG TPA: DNA ligase D [Alphaproteobacteria bacterium]
MGLKEYQKKRDFKKTPEPGPKVGRARKTNLSYLIQKHDATRLHYDFRLEMDGVLLSWAVTKGPSLNPSDKRLAVRTEDHPLSYGSFEGIIPKGQYGGGTVMLWDQGTWEPKGDPHAGLKKGHLSFTLKGKRLHGAWGLIRMHTPDKRENWLLVKEKDAESLTGKKAEKFLEEEAFSITTGRSMDEIADQKTKTWSSKKSDKVLDKLVEQYPDVQLATLVDHPPKGKDWVHEIKFDGYRLLGFVSNGAVRLRTRNGNDWTDKFTNIAEALSKLDVKDAVFDMEAVVMDENGKTSFQGLKNTLGGDTDKPIIACIFDLLHLNGKPLADQSLLDRKEPLQKILSKAKNPSLQYSDHVAGNGDTMIAKSCQLGLEGIISKLAEAPYSAGRQKFWLKSKCNKRQEFVILGYSDPKKGQRAMGALYLGYYKGNRMQYAGKVGTGFTMRTAADIVRDLKKIEIKKPNFSRDQAAILGAGEYARIHWVKPEVLCEVTFTEWTDDGHLRHPSFEGLRTDKKPIEVKEEKPIKVASAEKAAEDKIAIKPKKAKSGDLVLEGITITHPERVISETGHITKGELAEYYAKAAPYMLESMGGHPISLLRCPDGVGEGKECFYQRNPGRGLGPDVKPFHFKHKDKNYEYLYVENPKGIIEIIQMGAIEIHPWGAKTKNIDYPDRMIFDLDPDPSVPFEAVKLAALDLRKRLKKVGLEANLKCTGGKGLHVTVPLAEKDTWDEVKRFAEKMADQMVADVPEAYIATMSKSKREGKIFIDFFRNDYTATAIVDYGVRAREGAPVAMPLNWSELKKLKSPSQFSIKDALKRLGKVKNTIKPQRLPKGK